MKQGIHPKYYPDAKVTCASCGNTWTTGSTQKEIRVEICSKCHPFFSGESARMIDIEGQVDRFYKKLQVRQNYVEEKKARSEAKVSPKRPIGELELGVRATAALGPGWHHRSRPVPGEAGRGRGCRSVHRRLWPQIVDRHQEEIARPWLRTPRSGGNSCRIGLAERR